ncbi:hypothetical protein H4R20_002712 [Coemansia guatemalensis]|uniref:Lysozyme-like protein n=1 Tax=Coemansia guatemalensis TaxID=2761395 RepID=A0A9W8HZG6_9FUNG|nr:hypothetical protein H4R20_002712 [Coemansia guatemalensis]
MKLPLSLTLGIAAVALLKTVDAGLAGCPKSLAIQLTNVFQFGQIEFTYNSCVQDSSIGGYRAGIANFNTVDGSAWNVIKAYHKMTNDDDEFSKYDDAFQNNGKSSGTQNSDLFSGFCDTWERASQNVNFQWAQESILEKKYFQKSQSEADDLGLELSISQAQLYDAAISHGTSSKGSSLGGMIKATNKNITTDILGSAGSILNINGYEVNEIEWLKLFLQVRSTYDSAPGAKASIASYSYMIDNMLSAYSNDDKKDRNVFNWGNKIDVLNDVGKPGDVTCTNTYSSLTASPQVDDTTCNNYKGCDNDNDNDNGNDEGGADDWWLFGSASSMHNIGTSLAISMSAWYLVV